MRLFKLLAVCLLLSLGTAACGADARVVYQEMLDTSFKGQHTGKMIEEFGPPDEKTADSYTWKDKYTWVTGGYWYECTRTHTIYNKRGKVVGYIEENDTCYAEEVTHKRWCNTTVFFDVAKIVTGFNFDGSEMWTFLVGTESSGCFINNGSLFEPDLAFRKYD